MDSYTEGEGDGELGLMESYWELGVMKSYWELGAMESWVWWSDKPPTEGWVRWRAWCDGELLSAGCDGELLRCTPK